MADIYLLLNERAINSKDLRGAIHLLREEGRSLIVRPIYEPENVSTFTEEALNNDAELIIACGGDGLFHYVVNLALNHKKKLPSLSIMPFGTANDFAKNFSFNGRSIADQLRMVIESKAVLIDLGKANDAFFHNCVSGGLGASITSGTPKGLKDLLGGTAYALNAPATISTEQTPIIEFKTGNFHWRGEALFWAVANGPNAGGQRISPDASFDDGELDLLIIPKIAIDFWPQLLAEFVSGEPGSGEFIQKRKIKEVKIKSDSKFLYNLDGESNEGTNLNVEIKERSLSFQALKI